MTQFLAHLGVTYTPATGIAWSSTETMIVITGILLTSIGHIGCLVSEIILWQHSVLCEQETWCTQTSHVVADTLLNVSLPTAHHHDLDGVAQKCGAVDAAVSTMFWFYSLGIVVLVVKTVFVLMFLLTQTTNRLSLPAILDWYTLERGVAGMCFWGVTTVLETCAFTAWIYRLFWIEVKFRKDDLTQLYANVRTDTLRTFVAYTIFATLSFLVVVYCLVTRAAALRYYLKQAKYKVSRRLRRMRSAATETAYLVDPDALHPKQQRN